MSITKIAEEMLKREYLKKNISLPVKFWNSPLYKPKYQHQMRRAAQFVRAYGIEAVQAVVDRETWCFSLAAKSLPNLMEIEMGKIKTREMVRAAQVARPKEIVDETASLFRYTKEERKEE